MDISKKELVFEINRLESMEKHNIERLKSFREIQYDIGTKDKHVIETALENEFRKGYSSVKEKMYVNAFYKNDLIGNIMVTKQSEISVKLSRFFIKGEYRRYLDVKKGFAKPILQIIEKEFDFPIPCSICPCVLSHTGPQKIEITIIDRDLWLKNLYKPFGFKPVDGHELFGTMKLHKFEAEYKEFKEKVDGCCIS